ncbi:type I inositol polyphosphate 5-phosphatase 5 isoform X1 [Nicotiana sylvestris]|uniref:Type I inositol 1,4,5-trisphosphate 5-phosphatase CVP2 isoform X1 n=2 Tax=Nicotiana sylvestris TaxID=4096 RepID=A0A1U7XRL5_NICSY|nr:PREDICTED: type I inositol 1,4,5-trisphosphate 5-phosphatase CVP2 isoform X1 [Nicotiana sylvestris]
MSSPTRRCKSDDNIHMIKAAAINTTPGGGARTSPSSSTATTPDNSVKGEKKKCIIPKLFSSKRSSIGGSEEDLTQSDNNDQEVDWRITSRRKAFLETSSTVKRSFSERHNSARIEGLNLSTFDHSTAPATMIKSIRVFAGTWNVGGKAPNHGLNLEDFLQVEGSADIYVLGFQEIVPLNAGNILVSEDSEPAARWLALISHALNKSYHESVQSCDSSYHNSKHSKSNSFHKHSLKSLSKSLRTNSTLLKTCNCPLESTTTRRQRKLSDPSCSPLNHHRDSSEEDLQSIAEFPSSNGLSYNLIASKQMVGIFLSVWARKELAHHIGHLRISSLGRGIMGCLGNKGCIAISMSLYRTSFCFVCSHLASGEKEGDELRRNADVAEILKSIQFSRICTTSDSRMAEKISDHDRVIWLGDLNYRVSLSYEETRLLLEDNDWDSLLEKDQLNVEREAGRVFSGWNEGKIFFAPTYKYSHNSDSYAGETTKSKKKRRTPAWCDRILWRGEGIEQLSYIRGESRFSDHRPVCAVFAVDVEAEAEAEANNNSKFRKGFSCTATRLEYEDLIPLRHSSYHY